MTNKTNKLLRGDIMKIEKRNGKLTKIVKMEHMARMAVKTGLNRYSLSGIARRVELTEPVLIRFIKWLNKEGRINTTFDGRCIVFNF